MSAKALRRLRVWSGWVGLFLAFMPSWRTAKEPRPADESARLELTLPFVGDIPQESTQTRFTVGLPFSPWFRYERNVRAKTVLGSKAPAGAGIKVTTTDGRPAPRVDVQNLTTTITVKDSWKMPLPNWSAVVAVAAIALLVVPWPG